MAEKKEFRKGLMQKLHEAREGGIVGKLPVITPIVDGNKKPLITGIENPRLKRERKAVA